MNSKELYSIREWAPLTDIMEKIPTRMTRALGIFLADLNVTCVDAIAEFIALGSDAGIVFWYNRHTGELQKLRTEFVSRITCVKIVNSVEYMVAAGNAGGQVSVFQIQKQLPPDLNLVAPCTRAKPIERYTIRDLHRCAVGCVEWSKNGMKLYSGDRQGVVVLTEFDFQAHLSKSVEILSEAYEIVQLSVHQSYLLVSTLYRSVICQRNAATGQWRLTQVGKKDRKQLTDCGGIFLKYQTRRPLLICGRPGLRFWLADTEGNVEKTLLFREAVASSPTWEIPILNPKAMAQRRAACAPLANNTKSDMNSRNFCTLQLYAGQDMLVVTHDESSLYILNLDRLRVEAVARGFRKILDFCVHDREIFILEGSRSLLRLAPLPEKPSKTAKVIFNPSMPPPVPQLGALASSKFESPVEFEPDEQPVIKAEECFELPPIEALNLNVQIELAVESPRAEQNRRLEIFNQISEMDFDHSILYHSGLSQNGRKKRTRRSRERHEIESSGSLTKSHGIVEIAKVVDPEADASKSTATLPIKEFKKASTLQEQTTKPTLMDISYCASAVAAGDHLATAVAAADHEATATNRAIEEPSTAAKAERYSTSYATTPPTTSKEQRKSLEKPKTLAEELNLAGICLGPRRTATSEYSSITPPSPKQIQAPAPTPTPTPLKELALIYPSQPQVEDAGVQTTPRKKAYYLDEDICHDYSAGQPIDDICHAALCAASLVEDYVEATPVAESAASDTSAAAGHLQFVPTQPVTDEIDSFLLDFRRVQDPCAPHSKSPPPSAESNGSSSEWEFLDN